MPTYRSVEVVVRFEYEDAQLIGLVVTVPEVDGGTRIDTEWGWRPADERLTIQDVVKAAAFAIRRAHNDATLT